MGLPRRTPCRPSVRVLIQTYPKVDKHDDVSSKPDFTVLLYPAYMNKGEALSEDFTVSDELSPTLIITAKDDGFFPEVKFTPRRWKKPAYLFVSTFLKRVVTDFPFGPKSIRFPLGPNCFCSGLRI